MFRTSAHAYVMPETLDILRRDPCKRGPPLSLQAQPAAGAKPVAQEYPLLCKCVLINFAACARLKSVSSRRQ